MSAPLSLDDVRQAMPCRMSDLQVLNNLKTKFQEQLKPTRQMAREQRSHCINRLVFAGFFGGGGIFLLLAAHQVLPHGMNAMSQLTPWSQIGGYGLIAICLGSLITPTRFAYMSWADLRKEKKAREKEFNQAVDSLTEDAIKSELTITEMLEVTVQKEHGPVITLFVKGAQYSRHAHVTYNEWSQLSQHNTGKKYAQIFADENKHIVALGNLIVRWSAELATSKIGTLARCVQKVRAEVFG